TPFPAEARSAQGRQLRLSSPCAPCLCGEWFSVSSALSVNSSAQSCFGTRLEERREQFLQECGTFAEPLEELVRIHLEGDAGSHHGRVHARRSACEQTPHAEDIAGFGSRGRT